MIELKINFAQVRNRVDAAAALQEAGEETVARAVMRKLATDILKKLNDGDLRPDT
jgi:hypothetical protein